MRKQLLILCILLSPALFAQRGILYIKRGYKKMAAYAEGDPIRLQLQTGAVMEGYIALIKNDSVFVNGEGFPASLISTVYVPRKKDENFWKQFWYATAGVAISTTGMTLAKWTDFKTALAVSATLGYARYLWMVPQLFKRKKYPIGKKFTIQLLDLHFGGGKI